MIDAHAHLDDPRFRGDVERVIASAIAAGVTRIVSCGGDVGSSEVNARLAREHDAVRAAVGVHPHRASTWSPETAIAIERLASLRGVVAIGEIGIDHSGRSGPADAQERAFTSQLELARRLDLPAVIHVRDAGLTTRTLFDRAGGARGMIHCYSEGPAEVEEWIARGVFISFAGNVTYPSNGRLREAARQVPRDRILVETDAPYLQPQSRRREPRNEPAFVLETLAAVAEVRGEDPGVLGMLTSANAAALFGRRWPAGTD